MIRMNWRCHVLTTNIKIRYTSKIYVDNSYNAFLPNKMLPVGLVRDIRLV
jgi:hypothetical protein